MPTRNSTSSESPSSGLPKAPPMTVTTSTSIAASMATPPSSATRSGSRLISLLTAVLRGGGEEIVKHLLAGEAALVHLLHPEAIHRPHGLGPARLLLLRQREHVVARVPRLLARAFGKPVPDLADVLGVFEAGIVVDRLAQLGRQLGVGALAHQRHERGLADGRLHVMLGHLVEAVRRDDRPVDEHAVDLAARQRLVDAGQRNTNRRRTQRPGGLADDAPRHTHLHALEILQRADGALPRVNEGS